MTAQMEQMGIDLLTPDERIILARDILDSVAPTPLPLPLSEAKRRDLALRLEEAKADPDGGTPWEEIYAATMARLGR